MSTATQQLTQEQVRANFRAAQKRVEPAILNNSFEGRSHNEVLITQKMLAGKKEPTADNFYQAINQLVEDLMWTAEPAKLAAIKENKRPIVAKSAQKEEGEFVAKVRAGEAVDAQAKADAASIQQAKNLIEGYKPVKFTRGGSTYDHREISEKTAEWTAALEQAIAGKRNLQEHVAALAATIQKRYNDRERAQERL